jgi:hypothetical protein
MKLIAGSYGGRGPLRNRSKTCRVVIAAVTGTACRLLEHAAP